ncbi:MAG: HDOD domain-containing protein [Desulfohalobiaceae bacterium]|nr:HDOD domain-containing protein [Desulfohalobiaceae bacterium]
MGRIGIKEVTPGMTLSRDVKDQSGHLLASSGQVLTQKMIRIFKIWGIAELWIQESADHDQAVDAEPELPETVRLQAEAVTRHRFQYNDLNDPFTAELFRISCLKKGKRLQQDPEDTPENTIPGDQDSLSGRSVKPKAKKINIDFLINKTLRLGSIPDIYYKTIAAINNPEASLDDIANIVSKDITLSAKVLQLVNSSFYSLRQKVDTLTWALALIGTNQLMTIVSGVSAVSLFKHIPSQLLNMVSFWEHSIACGTAARLLSGYFPERMDPERFFVAGLLHDIGRLILVQNLSKEYLSLLHYVRKEERFLFAAETEKFGVDHSEIGARLAVHWNLPESLVSMLKNHHFPEYGRSFREAAIVNLADILVNALEIGNSGETLVPVIEPKVCQELSLDKEILQPVINEIEDRLDETFAIIYGTLE